MRKQKRGAPANRSTLYWQGHNYLLQHMLEVNGHLRTMYPGLGINGMPIAKQSVWQRVKNIFS